MKIRHLIKFEAKWCASCKQIQRLVDQFKENHPDFKVSVVDVEDNIGAANFYNVRTLPTLVLTEREEDQLESDAEIVKKHVGVLDYNQLVQFATE